MGNNTKEVKVGGLVIGGGSSIKIQSMTNIDAADKIKTAAQLRRLEKAGCDIARLAINSMDAVGNIEYFKTVTNMPLVADIHFDYKLAVEAAAAGIDKIRINPGNIGSGDRIKKICDICRNKNIPIRVGVNSGSIEKEILAKYGSPTPEAIVESAVNATQKLKKYDFENIIVSIKSSSVNNMVKANRLLSEVCRFPLHIGVTEAGLEYSGTIKSAIGIGALLLDGIGDTIRVSLAGDVVAEVKAGREILKTLGLKNGINLIVCPTCGRTGFDLVGTAKKLDRELKKIKTEKTISIALMGCVVNGPGEAREADIGIAGGPGEAVLFKKGQRLRNIEKDKIVETLLKEVKELL